MTAPAPTHDSTLAINGVRLYVEERGSGAPIVCIHGAGSTTLAWTSAIDRLSGLGRVIAYDRRGCARSERPAHYERTSIAEHADDAAALIDALGAAPAVVIGRSYGATVATDLALRYPDRVRALVLLEGDASREQAPAVAAWIDGLTDRLIAVAGQDGVDAVAEALITEVADEGAWRAFPGEIRRLLESNGPAILAELQGEWWLDADAAALATIRQSTLLVAAADSPPEFREPVEVLAASLPNARKALVGGGHLIDPAAPEVLVFIEEVLRAAVTTQAILLPGGVMPAPLAYGALLAALGDDVQAVAKELEIYADAAPPAGYTLQHETDGVLRTADAAGFDRFHLVGYSAGGAASLAFAARHPERLLSLALIEPAWMGNDELSAEERTTWREFDRIAALPPEQMLPAFVANQLATGVEPPPPPPGLQPPWMASRPAGLRTLIETFRTGSLDLDRLRAFGKPVLFALGGKSNPDYYGRMAERATTIFPDMTLEVFTDRHHFDPPHRLEPERTATVLQALWERASG